MEQSKKGFTLLELLIVITILAILTLVIVIFINPVEILKKSRDVQRMSDLATMKTAIALYLQAAPSNTLGESTYCTASSPASESTGTTRVRMSLGAASTAGEKSGTDSGTKYYLATTTTDLYKNNGQGWIPYINFSTMTGGAPIEKLPVDPINTGGGTAAVAGVDSLYYRYACKTGSNTFELDATLESEAYKYLGTDDKPSKDGGNAVMRFEVGTDLNILPSTAPVNFSL